MLSELQTEQWQMLQEGVNPKHSSQKKWYHKLVKKTEMALYLSFPRDKFFSTKKEDGVFEIKVSPRQTKRALRLLDTMIEELEHRGYPVYAKERKLFVRILQIDVAIVLKEKSRRVTIKEKPNVHSFDEYDFIPTGEFILSIENIYVEQRIQKNFIDNKSGKLEDKLNDIIVALIIAAQAQKAKDKHWEELEKKWKIEERKKKEAEEKIRLEKKKLDELRKNAVLLQESKLIRDYIEEYKKRKSPLTLEDEEYIGWTLEQVAGMDPFGTK